MSLVKPAAHFWIRKLKSRSASHYIIKKRATKGGRLVLELNFIKTIENRIRESWYNPCFSDYGGSGITYGELAERILRFHYIFRKAHLKPGAKIAVAGKNSVNWAVAYLATVTYGAVIVPILPDFHPDDIQYIINHSDSEAAFISDSIRENIYESELTGINALFSLRNLELVHCSKRTLPVIVKRSEEEYLEGIEGGLTPRNFTLPEVSNAELAAIVYTSGTTSFSKGVMLPHNSLMANIKFAMENLKLHNGDRILSFLPLAHSYGCAFEFLYPFCSGCHVTFLSKMPSPKILLKAFSEVRPHLILAVPLILEKIYRKQIKVMLDKGSIKLLGKTPVLKGMLHRKINTKLKNAFGGEFFQIVIGGAALNAEVEAFLREIGFPCTVGYGMTECGPLISYSDWRETRFRSVGRVVDTLEARIDAPDPETGVGEICVRGENVMTGYYKNDEAGREAIDDEGWLHTGDMGTMDDEGFIYIKGRSKNMILGPSGQNIYPEEIEAKLNYMPFVQESLVLERNGRIVALVYPDMELVEKKNLSESTLRERMEENLKALNDKLPAFSNVAEIELYPEEFEKTPSKKIKRFLYTIASSDSH